MKWITGTRKVLVKVILYGGFVYLLSIYCGLVSGISYGSEIYVSPSGSDSNAGTLISPLKTLEATRDLVRKKYLSRSENKLPRVLIIGDSISIGYTPPLRELLKGKAIVYHNAGNGGPTTRGLANLDKWLNTGGNKGKWDIIHFNFGLHDLKFMNDRGQSVAPSLGHHQVALEQYGKNLEKLVLRLKKTGAKLIFATTTPVPANTPIRIQGESVLYNKVALKVMKRYHIAIDDLYSAAKSRLSKIQRPHNVHYTKDGYRFLAQHVAAAIRKKLSNRKIENKNSNQSAVVVYLRGGTYQLKHTFKLGAEDSGTNAAGVIYRAYKKEQVLITGGERFNAGSLGKVSDPAIRKRLPVAVRDKVLEIDLRKYPGYKPSPWPTHFTGYAGWPEIYIGDKPLRLSRWPNNGYAKIVKVIDSGAARNYGDKSNHGGTFVYGEKFLSILDVNDGIYLGGYWKFKWRDETIKVASIDKAHKQITLAAPHIYGLGGPSGGLYYALNIPEALDTPGEYVYDYKRGHIYLLPPDINTPVNKLGSTGDKGMLTGVIAFGQYPLIGVTGAANIRFNGLTIAYNCGNAIVIKNSHDIALSSCTIKGISRTAVVITGGDHCGLSRCHLYNLGETGVSLSGGNRDSLTPSGHYLMYSYVNHYARLKKNYCPAANLSGVGQYVGYNYIHDAPHNAVLFRGNDHIIENNRIERVCLDTADAGAIYCGRDWTLGGNIIRRNYIAHLGPASHNNNWGIYLDDMASGITATDNVVVDSPGGMLIGGGRNNTVTNNLIVRCKDYSIYYDSRGYISPKWKIPTRQATKVSPRPKNMVMWLRLDRCPYKSPIWRKRFPWLLKLDTDPEPGIPKYNVVTGNRAFDCPDFRFSKYAREFSIFRDNKIMHADLPVRFHNRHIIIPAYRTELKRFSHFLVGP